MKRTKSGFIPDPKAQEKSPSIRLEDGSRVAVMGGGPAGSLFAYFLLDLAHEVDLELEVDVFEPRNFALPGPPGCNMCAGIVSESLVQNLAVEGINLPPTVIQRGMDSYVVHIPTGSTRLETPQLERRIGVVFRGAGPLGIKNSEWSSFDGFLLDQAVRKGATLIGKRVDEVSCAADGCPLVKTRGAPPESYDLLAVASGVNTNALKLLQSVNTAFRQPETVRTFVREYFLGRDEIERTLGEHTIHFFLLDIPGMDFAAIVPKGDYVTVALLGEKMDNETCDLFLNTPQVKACMPSGWTPEGFACHCGPRINQTGALHPYADRMVFIGDTAVSRLYKDGIGAAYRAAKYAAAAAVFHGIGEKDFQHYFWDPYHNMEYDNVMGKIVFFFSGLFKPRRFASDALIRMMVSEQPKPAAQRRMSSIIWNMCTGSAPYREILFGIFHPAFWSRLLWYLSTSLVRSGR
jgi:flavin-dependent dehydrogenase